jgi:hypothetical protein
MTDTVTVLRSLSGVLTKRLARSAAGWKVTLFSAGTWFSVHGCSVGDPGKLLALLARWLPEGSRSGKRRGASGA